MIFSPANNSNPGMRRNFCSRKEVPGLVSVVIPSYQSKWCVGEAIDSVLAQTYKQYEIVVVDDGSTDGTADYLVEKYSDQVKIVRQNNQGLAAARNSGLEAARGEYIQFLDADDLLLPQKFEMQVAFLKSHPEVDSVICYVRESDLVTGEVNQKLPRIKVDDLFPALLWNNCIGAVHGPITRLSVVKEIGGFDESFRNYCADWELWLTIAWLGHRFALIPEYLGIYRRSMSSLRKSMIYPNTIGDLHVALRAGQYAEIAGNTKNWQVDDVLCLRHERAAYWAARELGFKKTFEHAFWSIGCVPNKRKPKQLIRVFMVIAEAWFVRNLENNPKVMLLAKKIRNRFLGK